MTVSKIISEIVTTKANPLAWEPTKTEFFMKFRESFVNTFGNCGRFAEALPLAERAVELNPSLIEQALLLGEVLGDLDRTLEDGRLGQGTVALGGDYARVRTDARVVGQGATTKQIALYYADGHQMHDFRTLQDHVAPRTNSDLLFKGAVQDSAKSVYTGLIRIGEDAKGSVAYQTNRNLTLSEGAWAESVPNLDIRTNDVKCSHASTVGPIDDEQRFYLESRGIPPETAERLVVLGFFDDVLGALPVGALRDDLRARVAEKLQGRVA